MALTLPTKPKAKSEIPPPPPSARRFGYGHLPDPYDARDLPAGPRFGAPRNLPRENLVLKGLVRRIRNQGQTSACVGCATATAVDTRLRKMGAVAPEPSALAMYGLARGYGKSAENEAFVDNGCYPRMMMKGIRESGVPSEEAWPFDPTMVNISLPWDVHQAATAFKLRAWRRVDVQGDGRLDEIANVINQGFPVPYGRVIDQAFEDYDGKGVVDWNVGTGLGGHDTCIVGWTTDSSGERIWCIANSWGDGWGDGGFYWARSRSLTFDGASDFYVVEVDGPDVGSD